MPIIIASSCGDWHAPTTYYINGACTRTRIVFVLISIEDTSWRGLWREGY